MAFTEKKMLNKDFIKLLKEYPDDIPICIGYELYLENVSGLSKEIRPVGFGYCEDVLEICLE